MEAGDFAQGVRITRSSMSDDRSLDTTAGSAAERSGAAAEPSSGPLDSGPFDSGPFERAFIDIAKAIDLIEERLAFVVDRAVLGDALCSTVELANRVSGLTARVADQCTGLNVAALSGQRTMGQYVAARTNCRGRDVDRVSRIARWLRDFPVLQAAFGNELTQAHVDYMRKHLDGTYASHVALIQDQQFFVDTAAQCSYQDFVTAADYWVAHVDPDGKEPNDQIDRAGFRIRTGRGGRGELTGSCDAVTASRIKAAVESEADKLRIQDKEQGVERSDSQRRMAALAALVERGHARPDGTVPGLLGGIVMSQSVAEWALAALGGGAGGIGADGTAPALVVDGERVPVHPVHVDGRCELVDGTPIHPFLAVQALGLLGSANAAQVAWPAVFRRYIMDVDSRLLDVSVNARRFPEWMRTAGLVRSRGRCTTDGCEAPHHWLEHDHVQPVHHGGDTCLDNEQPQCRPDNQAKGATPGLAAWRDREPPRRRSIRRSRLPEPDDPDDRHA